jgi:hypothetical protein
VTIRVNHLEGSKESFKVQTKKCTLQLTTSDDILSLKLIIGSTITVSTRNGFLTVPKRLQSADNYLYSKQNAAVDSDYVNAVLLCDDADNNSPDGFFFLWTPHVTERLQVTTQ